MTDQLKPTSASEWANSRQSSVTPVPVELPSGNVALCRRVGLEVFMRLGLIPNSLMSIVSKHIDKAKKGKAVDEQQLDKDLEKILQDTSKLADLMDMVDKVTVHIVVEPQIQPAPTNGKARDPELLYVDIVDFEDKMFLFQWASGGLESVEGFRDAAGPAVVPVLDGDSAVDQAKSTAGR